MAEIPHKVAHSIVSRAMFAWMILTGFISLLIVSTPRTQMGITPEGQDTAFADVPSYSQGYYDPKGCGSCSSCSGGDGDCCGCDGGDGGDCG